MIVDYCKKASCSLDTDHNLGNKLGEKGSESIAEALKVNKTLTSLNIASKYKMIEERNKY